MSIKRRKALVDSGYLYHLLHVDNPRYQEFNLATRLYFIEPLVPYVILSEVAYLFRKTRNPTAPIQFLDSLATLSAELIITTTPDFIRAREIMAQYLDARLDFVDCCIMAMAERLNITTICTVDQRDFRLVQPKHCAFYDILP